MLSFDMHHLKEAARYARQKADVKFYFWHAAISLNEAFWLFLWSVGSVVHAIFPFLLKFDLLEARINSIKTLKQKLPDDPRLKKVKFDD